jgi:hypothetical protein
MHPRHCQTFLPAARFGYRLSSLLAVLALGLLLNGFSAPAANSDLGYTKHTAQALVASDQGSRLRFVATAPDRGDNSPSPSTWVSLLLPQSGSQEAVFFPVAGHVVRHPPNFWPILRAPPLT